MTEKVHRIHSLPTDSPWQGGLPPTGSDEHPRSIRALDRVLAIQRPVVLAHLRSIRLRHPDASSADIVRILERRYLAAVTTGGAAVGATAVVPGIGTGVTLALSGVETVAFPRGHDPLRTVGDRGARHPRVRSRPCASSRAHPHAGQGRRRPRRAARRAGGRQGADPRPVLGRARDQDHSARRHGTDRRSPEDDLHPPVRRAWGRVVDRQGAPLRHRAAIGGAGNNILGRRVLVNSRRAFGPPPPLLPVELEPRPGATRIERAATRTIRRAGSAVVGGVARGASTVGGAARRITVRRREVEAGEPPHEDLGDD